MTTELEAKLIDQNEKLTKTLLQIKTIIQNGNRIDLEMLKKELKKQIISDLIFNTDRLLDNEPFFMKGTDIEFVDDSCVFTFFTFSTIKNIILELFKNRLKNVEIKDSANTITLCGVSSYDDLIGLLTICK